MKSMENGKGSLFEKKHGGVPKYFLLLTSWSKNLLSLI